MTGAFAFAYTRVPTAIGAFTVVCSERGVVRTAFSDEGEDPQSTVALLESQLEAPLRAAPGALRSVAAEVRGFFARRTRAFETPVDLSTMRPGFARRVLETTASIPFGELWTYGDVAEHAGSPRGGRAAGGALGRCPIELFVPCHRVVHAGGTIGGYGRHEDRKRWLITHERAG